MKRYKKRLILATIAASFSAQIIFGAGFVSTPTAIEGTNKIYSYKPYNQYVVNTKLGRVTDIQLRANEKLQKIASGDSLQWQVVADDISNTQHVYLKPMQDDVETNMIINTDKRSYRLFVKSNDKADYVVSFIFPEEDEQEHLENMAIKEKEVAEYQEAKLALMNATYNSHYVVKRNEHVRTEFIPKAIFNDGVKTFIVLSKDNKENMPVLFSFDPWDKKKLQLVNYRLINDILVVDKKLTDFKIAFSQDSYLIISESEKVTYPKAKEITFEKKDLDEYVLATKFTQPKKVQILPKKEEKAKTVVVEKKKTEEDVLDKIDKAIDQIVNADKKDNALVGDVNALYQKLPSGGDQK